MTNPSNQIRADRPSVVGDPAGPAPPFPLRLEGPIIKGFGRGSKELGIPTANIPIDGPNVAGRDDITTGIYFGYAGLHAPAAVHATTGAGTDAAPERPTAGSSTPQQHAVVYPMVMSVGWNPFYKNEKRSVEIHILHAFPADFYGAHIKLLILGFVREELNYVSKEALIEDILMDVEVARRSLEREHWWDYKEDAWLVEQ